MLILTTKLKNAINKRISGMEFYLSQITVNGNKRGTSGFIKNPENGLIIYVNTEGIKWDGKGRQYMYRYADSVRDHSSLKYRNRWAYSLDELAENIVNLLQEPDPEMMKRIQKGA